MTAPAWLQDLRTVVAPGTLHLPGTPTYTAETKTWSVQKGAEPSCLARPTSVEELSRLLKFLHDSDIDFAVRATGVGNASARDLLISMAAFTGFAFDAERESITIEAGQTWGDVDRKLAEHAPGYIALSARCSFIGVGGSTLHGGISWASSELGLTSDPENMLDALVVKANGDMLWASQEPDLLWALRGGGTGFAVLVALKLRVYRYPNDIYAGAVLLPNSALPLLAREIEAFAARTSNPRIAMHLFCLDTAHAAFTGQSPQPGIMVIVYDANGESHGRGSEGFEWLLGIEGAVDNTKSMSFREANQLQDSIKAAFGQTNSSLSAVTVAEVSESLILRMWKWFNDTLAREPKLSAGAVALLEVMQESAFSSLGDPAAAAWPHTSNKHILQLGTGAVPGSPAIDALAVRLLHEAPFEIVEGHNTANYAPMFIGDFNDVQAIYGANYAKLKELKARYDPKNRLGGFFA